MTLSSDDRRKADAAELVRRERAEQARLRRSISARTARNSIVIRMRVHLLAEDTETTLRRRLDLAESKLMLLRHSGAADNAALRHAEQDRGQLAQQLSEVVFEVAVEVGIAPSGSDGLQALHRRVRTAALAVAESTKSDAARLLDDTVEARLFALEGVGVRGYEAPDVRVVDDDQESRERARAVVAELRRLAELNDVLLQRVRHDAARRGQGSAVVGSGPRRTEALAALDWLRSLHAAMAEVETASSLDLMVGESGLPSDRSREA